LDISSQCTTGLPMMISFNDYAEATASSRLHAKNGSLSFEAGCAPKFPHNRVTRYARCALTYCASRSPTTAHEEPTMPVSVTDSKGAISRFPFPPAAHQRKVQAQPHRAPLAHLPHARVGFELLPVSLDFTVEKNIQIAALVHAGLEVDDPA